MSQPKITIIGKLRFSEETGLDYSVSMGKLGKENTLWLRADLENAYDWPGLGKYPKYLDENRPHPGFKDREALHQWSSTKKAAEDEFRRAREAYDQKLQADPAYRRAQTELMELQRREPQEILGFNRVFIASGSTGTWFFASNRENQNLSVTKKPKF